MENSISKLERISATVMFTDIAGYTKAMATDEDAALVLVHKKRSILKPLVSSNGGTFVKELGDGSLSYFHSAEAAATCAIHLQEALRNISGMNIRVGINSGMIIIDESDVFGDTVNVAARLESIAPIGGVCVSKRVFDELFKTKGYEGVYLGLQQLKNVGRLVEVYALQSAGLTVPDSKDYLASRVQVNSESETPTLAVLPFVNKGKPEDEFYTYAICSDLITSLTGAGKIRVISMTDTQNLVSQGVSMAQQAEKLKVRYLVSGMLWKLDENFQLAVEMFDAKDGSIVWSDRWQDHWHELDSIKGKLADSILKIAAVESSKNAADVDAVAVNSEAYKLYLEGKYWFETRKSKEDGLKALNILEKASEIDPGFIPPRLVMSEYYHQSGDYRKEIQILTEAWHIADNAADISGKMMTSIKMGNNYWFRGDIQKAASIFERAIMLSKARNDLATELEATIRAAYSAWALWNISKAKNLSERILELSDSLDSPAGRSQYYNILYNLSFQIGDFKNALKYAELIHQLYADEKNEVASKKAVSFMARVHQELGEHQKALLLFQDTLEMLERVDDPFFTAHTLCYVAISYFQLAAYDQAVTYQTKSLKLFRELEMKENQIFCLSWLAYTELKIANISLVEEHVLEIETLMSSTTPDKTEIVSIHWLLFQIYRDLKKTQKSRDHLKLAYNEIMTQSEALDDELNREMYLNIDTNSAVLSEYASSDM
jgi:class 3 adenylate cyclase/TolB-like protein